MSVFSVLIMNSFVIKHLETKTLGGLRYTSTGRVAREKTMEYINANSLPKMTMHKGGEKRERDKDI